MIAIGVLVAVSATLVWRRDGISGVLEILTHDLALFGGILPRVLAGCLLGAFIAEILPHEKVSRSLGPDSGLKGLLIGAAFGAILPGGPFTAYRRGPKVMSASLREGTLDFINIVPRIALGVIGSGYIAAVIPQEVITGWLGPDSGWLGVLTAVIAGAATPGGPVVGFSIGAVALKAGGGPPQVTAYVIAWALFAFQRVMLWEIPFMPARFVWFPPPVSVPFPFLAAAIAMAIGKP